VPDFKLVISDPQTKEPKVVTVKVKVSEKVESVKGEKEGRALPIALINQKTKEALGLDQFLTIETVKQEGDKKQKVKTHLLVKVSNEVPENEVWVSQTVGEKHGGNEFEAKAYRTKAFQLMVSSGQADSAHRDENRGSLRDQRRRGEPQAEDNRRLRQQRFHNEV